MVWGIPPWIQPWPIEPPPQPLPLPSDSAPRHVAVWPIIGETGTILRKMELHTQNEENEVDREAGFQESYPILRSRTA